MTKDRFDELMITASEKIINLCEEFDGRWQRRQRIIDSSLIVILILRMTWSKSSEGYGSALSDLWNKCSGSNLILKKKTPVSTSSFCEARVKLDEDIFRRINQVIADDYETASSSKFWNGHRVFAVDGSIIDLPRSLVQQGYALRSEKSYYPQGLLSCAYNVKTGIPYHFELANHKNERFCAVAHLKAMKESDVVVYDRGYFSYAILYHHLLSGVHGVFRLKSTGNFPEIQSFIDSGARDSVVTLFPVHPMTRRDILRKNPDISIKPLLVRVLKANVGNQTYYFATTLINSRYRPSSIAAIYRMRWSIEELYKIAKNHIAFEDFHSKTERGVKQETYAMLLLVTLTRIMEQRAAIEVEVTTVGSKKNLTRIPLS